MIRCRSELRDANDPITKFIKFELRSPINHAVRRSQIGYKDKVIELKYKFPVLD